MHRLRQALLITTLLALAISCVGLALTLGSVSLTSGEIVAALTVGEPRLARTLVMELRLPRALMVLHDIDLAQRYCNRLLLLFGDGTTCQGATFQVLTCKNLERLYGHPMLRWEGPKGPIFLPA